MNRDVKLPLNHSIKLFYILSKTGVLCAAILEIHLSYLSFNQSVQIEKYFSGAVEDKLLLCCFDRAVVLSIHFAYGFRTGKCFCR